MDYRHDQATRLSNPTAALAREDVAPVPERRFAFDPHLDPQLVWAGKTEQQDIAVEAPSIHVHERLSTEAIMKAAPRENAQIALFVDPGLDRATQVAFYEHEMGWAQQTHLGRFAGSYGEPSGTRAYERAGPVGEVMLDEAAAAVRQVGGPSRQLGSALARGASVQELDKICDRCDLAGVCGRHEGAAT